MSPRKLSLLVPDRFRTEVNRAAMAFALEVRDARMSRRWTVAQLADAAGLSPDMVYRIEAGQPASAGSYARIAIALGRRLDLGLIDPRRRADQRGPLIDLVHSAMGELEAGHLRRRGYPVGLDEPYQHFQFAGRGDVVAWSLERAALLHIENRTRFPDLQEAAGVYNAKRAYLPAALADRLGVKRWRSVTHVIACLWSSEVLHVLRLRTETFRALCPDPAAAFAAWWSGEPPATGTTSTLIVLDPLATGRQQLYIDLAAALAVRPRHAGYAAVAARLGDRAGR